MSDLVEVDRGFPVVVVQQVEMSHSDFTEVTVPLVSPVLSSLDRAKHVTKTTLSSILIFQDSTYPGWYLSKFVL